MAFERTEPTEITSGLAAGHASSSAPSLPAAATITTSAAHASCSASCSSTLGAYPSGNASDRLITSAPFVTACASASIRSSSEPLLVLSRTLIGISFAPAATPGIAPFDTISDAMCVPCWWSSFGWPSFSTRSSGATIVTLFMPLARTYVLPLAV